MSKEVTLEDILKPTEKMKVAELKKTMNEAPNKKEVDGIAAEIYAIYDEVRHRNLGEEC